MPAPGIRIVEIAVQDVARHFIIEANIVIAHYAGIRHGKKCVNTAGKFRFVYAFLARFLRGNTCDYHSTRLRQVIIGRLTVKNLRLANDREISVSADRRKLRWPVQRGASAKGFVIVEEKCGKRGGIRHQ
ncbi:hypothetical protein D3C78_1018440 [compost metagenome]